MPHEPCVKIQRCVGQQKNRCCFQCINKKKAWDRVHVEFNAQPYVEKRNVDSLQKAWENVKRKRRQDISKERLLRMKSGGGTFDSPVVPEYPELDSLLNNVDIEVKGVEDSDHFFSQSKGNITLFDVIPTSSGQSQIAVPKVSPDTLASQIEQQIEEEEIVIELLG